MGDLYGMAISEFVTISERHQEHGDHILHKKRHSQSLSGGLQGRTAFVFGAGQYDGNVAGEIQFIRLSLASSGHQVRVYTYGMGYMVLGRIRAVDVGSGFPPPCDGDDWQSLPLCVPLRGRMALTSI